MATKAARKTPKRGNGVRKPNAPHLGLTTQRKEAALAALRDTGLYARAAEAAGVSAHCITDWRKDGRYPEFEAECQAALVEYQQAVCTLAAPVVKQHLEDVLARRTEVVETEREEHVEGEGVVTLRTVERRPVHANASILSKALNRLDPRWAQAGAAAVQVNLDITLQSLVEEAPDERVVSEAPAHLPGGEGA